MGGKFFEILCYKDVIFLCSYLGIELKVKNNFYSNVEDNSSCFLVSCVGTENSKPSDSSFFISDLVFFLFKSL